MVKVLSFISMMGLGSCVMSLQCATSIWPVGLEREIIRRNDIWIPVRVPDEPRARAHAVIYDKDFNRYLIYESRGQARKTTKSAFSDILSSAKAVAFTAACWMFSHKFNQSTTNSSEFLSVMLKIASIPGAIYALDYGSKAYSTTAYLCRLLRRSPIVPQEAARLNAEVGRIVKEGMHLPARVKADKLCVRKLEENELRTLMYQVTRDSEQSKQLEGREDRTDLGVDYVPLYRSRNALNINDVGSDFCEFEKNLSPDVLGRMKRLDAKIGDARAARYGRLGQASATLSAGAGTAIGVYGLVGFIRRSLFGP